MGNLWCGELYDKTLDDANILGGPFWLNSVLKYWLTCWCFVGRSLYWHATELYLSFILMKFILTCLAFPSATLIKILISCLPNSQALQNYRIDLYTGIQNSKLEIDSIANSIALNWDYFYRHILSVYWANKSMLICLMDWTRIQ